jgi:alkyl sulfatase BDS1-like metallo-beta-lactamase superfamily hydrolase
VEMMGGAERILAKARELHGEGLDREAMEILNKLLYAEPENVTAKDLLADVFEQIGYRKESPSVRNSFLAAAFELRNGFPEGAAPQLVNPEMVRAMSTALLLDFLAIRVDSSRAEEMRFTINLHTPDNGEMFILEMSNATLTSCQGFLLPKADLSIEILRSDLEEIMSGQSTLQALAAAGKAKLEGEVAVVHQLQSVLVQFCPDFELLPGTRAARAPSGGTAELFEQLEPASSAGG